MTGVTGVLISFRLGWADPWCSGHLRSSWSIRSNPCPAQPDQSEPPRLQVKPLKLVPMGLDPLVAISEVHPRPSGLHPRVVPEPIVLGDLIDLPDQIIQNQLI